MKGNVVGSKELQCGRVGKSVDLFDLRVGRHKICRKLGKTALEKFLWPLKFKTHRWR